MCCPTYAFVFTFFETMCETLTTFGDQSKVQSERYAKERTRPGGGWGGRQEGGARDPPSPRSEMLHSRQVFSMELVCGAKTRDWATTSVEDEGARNGNEMGGDGVSVAGTEAAVLPPDTPSSTVGTRCAVTSPEKNQLTLAQRSKVHKSPASQKYRTVPGWVRTNTSGESLPEDRKNKMWGGWQTSDLLSARTPRHYYACAKGERTQSVRGASAGNSRNQNTSPRRDKGRGGIAQPKVALTKPRAQTARRFAEDRGNVASEELPRPRAQTARHRGPVGFPDDADPFRRMHTSTAGRQRLRSAGEERLARVPSQEMVTIPCLDDYNDYPHRVTPDLSSPVGTPLLGDRVEKASQLTRDGLVHSPTEASRRFLGLFPVSKPRGVLSHPGAPPARENSENGAPGSPDRRLTLRKTPLGVHGVAPHQNLFAGLDIINVVELDLDL